MIPQPKEDGVVFVGTGNAQAFTAHGVSYETVAEVTARLALLSFQDCEPGVGISDGRETERQAIHAELLARCGSTDAVVRLLKNAYWLASVGAPILSISAEIDVVSR